MKPVVPAIAIAFALFVSLGNASYAQTTPALPNPVLYFIGQESYETGGKPFVRYRYDVFNSSSYPDAMFAPAPSLPPCGANTKAARSWVDIFALNGRRLNGFCALGKSSNLNTIWFALPEGEIPPSWIYIEIHDRQTNTKYKSNLAESTN